MVSIVSWIHYSSVLIEYDCWKGRHRVGILVEHCWKGRHRMGVSIEYCWKERWLLASRDWSHCCWCWCTLVWAAGIFLQSLPLLSIQSVNAVLVEYWIRKRHCILNTLLVLFWRIELLLEGDSLEVDNPVAVVVAVAIPENCVGAGRGASWNACCYCKRRRRRGRKQSRLE